MGNLSTYRASGLPVGSVTMMHKQTQQSLIVDNGAEFLRTGEYVPYQAKYATAAARGFFSVSGGNIYDLGVSGQASLGHFGVNEPNQAFKMLAYAKGFLGYLTTDERVRETKGVDTVYYFKSASGPEQLENPIIVRTPKHTDVGLDGSFELVQWMYRTISAPAWSDYAGRWFCVAASNLGSLQINSTVTTRAQNAALYLLSSIDGVSWENRGLIHTAHNLVVNLPNVTQLNSIALCPLGNSVHIFESRYDFPSTNSFASVTIVEIDNFGNIEGISGAVQTSLASGTNGAMGHNLVASPLSASTGYVHYPLYSVTNMATLAFLDTIGTYNSGVQTGNYALSPAAENFNSQHCGLFQMATNGTTVVGYCNSGTSQTIFRLTDVTNVRNTAVSTTTPTTAAGTFIGPYIGWTGQNYLVSVGDPSVTTTSVQYRIAPDAISAPTTLTNLTAWTDAALYYQSSVENSRVYKNHVLYINASTNWVAGNIATNATTDFTAVAAGAGRVPPRYISSVIPADGTNVLIARGCDASAMPATIAKYDLAAPHITPDLKYLGTSTCPVTVFGEFKRLTDPSNTIVHVPRTGTINRVLYSSNNGDTWAEATISAVTNVRDVDYIAGRYVVVGSPNTTNYAHATSLGGTWTAGTINSSAVTLHRLYNTGTALIAVNSTGNPYRSTTGTAWTVCSGTAVNGESSYAKIGTTHYLFVNASAARISRHQSTDDGVTWSAATTLSLVVSTGQIPYKITSFNNKFYFVLGVPNTAVCSADVFETADFTTITETPRAHLAEASTYLPGPVAVGTSLYHILPRYEVQNGSLVGSSNSFVNGTLISKLASSASTPSFIGCSEGVIQGNMVGYLRIK